MKRSHRACRNGRPWTRRASERVARVLASLGAWLLGVVALGSDPAELHLFHLSGNGAVDEGAAAAEFTLVRTRSVQAALSLEVVAESGSAEVGLDFAPFRETLRIDAGVELVSFRVPILNDGVVERNESFRVHVIRRDPSGTEIRRESALVTIVDDEVPASIDEKFDTELSEPPRAVLEFSNGQLLVATGDAGGSSLVRLHADGSRDTVFKPLHGWEWIDGLWLLPDDKVMIRGCRPDGVDVPCRWLLQRMDRDGNLDGSYADVGLGLAGSEDGPVAEVFPDGSVVAARYGFFRNLLIRLRPDGVPDPDFVAVSLFSTDEDARVAEITRMTDGDLLVLVNFEHLGAEVVGQNLIRLKPDGTVDRDFRFAEQLTIRRGFRVRGMFSAPAGRAYLDGEQDGFEASSESTSALIRILENGALDSTFRWASAPRRDWASRFYPSLVQSDGGILGLRDGYLSRLDGNGSMDRSFPPAGRFRSSWSLLPAFAFGPRLFPLRGGGFLSSSSVAPDPWIAPSSVEINGDTRALIKFDPALTHRSAFRIESRNSWNDSFTTPATLRLSESGGQIDGVIRRLGDSGVDTNVVVATSNGTAFAGLDYESLEQSVTFDSLQTIKPLPPVRILQDVWAEPEETILFELRGGRGEQYGRTGRTLLVVEDDDRPGSRDPSYQPLSHESYPSLWAAGLDARGRVVAVRSWYSETGPTRGWAIQRFDSSGQLDPTWSPGVLESVESDMQSASLAPTGEIYIAGRFRPDWNPATPQLHLARFAADGRRDTGFAPTFGAAEPWWPARRIGFYADGALLVAVRGLQPALDGSGLTQFRVLRLKQDGTTDPGFRSIQVIAGDITELIAGVDGKFWIVGSLGSVDGSRVDQPLVRLNPNGDLDASVPAAEARIVRFVQASAACSDGRGGLLLTGDFLVSNETESRGILRIRPDGTLDRSFPALPSLRGTRGIVMQGDGSFVVAGDFASVGLDSRQRLARLLSDGSVDRNFDPGDQLLSVQGMPEKVFSQPDGQVVVEFTPAWRSGVLRRFWGERRAALAVLPLEGRFFRAELVPYGRCCPVVVESSPSIEVPEWQPVWTNRVGNDIAVFRDAIPPGTSRRFYRTTVR